jgi:ISXO2-like transposase domain
LGKRKYNRGNFVVGIWVFGGVEKTPERKCFLVVCPDRKRETFFEFIKRFILPGSVIISDKFSTLDEIEGYYYEHYSVNHSHEHFVDPTTQVDTITIEGMWNGLKHLVPPRKRTVHGARVGILEFMWKRTYAGRLWDSLLEALMIVEWQRPA